MRRFTVDLLARIDDLFVPVSLRAVLGVGGGGKIRGR